MVVTFPEKLRFLFTNSRYKIISGGRGKGASWGIARALLLLGANRTLRMLCCREIQKSIKESVHQLLKDQIIELGLQDHYDILETEIRGKHNGTLFLYTGLQDHTVNSIKSYEGIDICHVAEAQSVKKRSWEILIPTIRKEGSEIWMDLNPELDTDETYKRFVINAPPSSQVVEMDYRDNPWFPDTLEQERQHCEKTDPEGYENIWLGKPRSAVPGAIYAREVTDLIREGRYCHVPYDPRLKVHSVWDMGWNDAMAIGLVQRSRSEIRIIDYLEFRFKRTDECGAILNAMPYNWGYDWLPHDGYDKERKTGTDDYTILRKMGRKVRPEKSSFPNIDEESGIRAARLLFPRVVINNVTPAYNTTGTGTERLLECLKRFARSIPKTTGEPALPIRNEFKHGADMFRYIGLAADRMENEGEAPKGPTMPGFRPSDSLTGVLGSMAACIALTGGL